MNIISKSTPIGTPLRIEMVTKISPPTRPVRHASIHRMTRTERPNFRQKKFMVYGDKGLGRIRVNDINSMAIVRHTFFCAAFKFG